MDYNNTNKVGLNGGGGSSTTTSQVDGLLAGLKTDLKNAVAEGDVTNVELLEATINELESQRTTESPNLKPEEASSSITAQYYKDEYGHDEDNFSIVGPSLDSFEIVEITGPFKTFEEFTSAQLTNLSGLDKLLASKGS